MRVHDLTIATTHAYTHTDVLITNRGARCRGPGAFLCLLLLRCAALCRRLLAGSRPPTGMSGPCT